MVSAGDLVLVEISNATGCYYYLSVSTRDLLIMDRFSEESAWSPVGIHSRKGSDGDLVMTRNQVLVWRITRDPFPIIWLGINSARVLWWASTPESAPPPGIYWGRARFNKGSTLLVVSGEGSTHDNVLHTGTHY